MRKNTQAVVRGLFRLGLGSRPEDGCGWWNRGREGDPLYKAHKLLVMAREHTSNTGEAKLRDLLKADVAGMCDGSYPLTGEAKLRDLLKADDPDGEVRDAWHAKETLHAVYDTSNIKVGAATVKQLTEKLQNPELPAEVNRLERTLERWKTQIPNWHVFQITNAPAEAVNNPLKHVKHIGFGFTNSQQLPHQITIVCKQTRCMQANPTGASSTHSHPHDTLPTGITTHTQQNRPRPRRHHHPRAGRHGPHNKHTQQNRPRPRRASMSTVSPSTTTQPGMSGSKPKATRLLSIM